MQQLKTLLQKNKKHIYLGLLLGFVFAVGALTPNVSNAIFGFSLSGIVTGIFKLIAYVFNFIAGIFFAIAAAFVSFALDLNMTVADPQKNVIADIGWRISRDIANLGFVLLTVIMAFTTIIRVQSYGAKKLLLNLIIAAIVVNFSFLIAGTLIDFSNTLTHFFIGRISPGGFGTGLTEVLANAFGPQKFMLEESDDPIPPDPSEEESGLVTFGVAVLSSIAGLFFIVFFTLLATIVLLMLAAMFLVRYVFLTYLLVLAPLAWLFWVFPALKSQNGKWWGYFWQYTFFAPAASFFVYLSLVAAERLQTIEYQTKIAGAIGGGLPGMLGKIAQQGTQMIVVSALMIGAITIAKSMGIAGADMANKAKDGLMKGAKTYAKNRATNLGTKLSQSKAGSFVSTKLGLAGKKLKGTGEDIEKKREEMQKKKFDINQRFEKGEITKSQKEAELKAANKGRLGLWLKDKTYGQRLKTIGGGAEKAGEVIDKQAIKKIEKGGFRSTMAKYAAENAGLIKKQEKKDGPKSLSEKEKDLQKIISEKQKFITSGRFKEGDKALSEYDKQIEIQTNQVVSARGGKYKSMTKEETQKEYSSLLEKEKKGGNKNEKELNRRTKELLEKTLSSKMGGKMTTTEQIDAALKEASTEADNIAIEGKDATFYREMVSSLEKQKSRIEGQLKATGKAFGVVEEKINTLNNNRSNKLAELKQSNPNMSNEEIKNHTNIQEIESEIKTYQTNLSKWKNILGKTKFDEETKNLQTAALNEMKEALNTNGNEDIIKGLDEKQTEIKKDLDQMKERKKVAEEMRKKRKSQNLSQEERVERGNVIDIDNV